MIPIRSFIAACFAVVMLATIASAQYANCSSSVLNDPCSVGVGQTVVTSVTYSDPFTDSANCSSNIACSNRSADFDVGCAVQGARAFVGCRQSGGGILGCAVEGFGSYLQCTGGVLSRGRARRIQRRQTVRANRSRSFRQNSRQNFCG